MVVAPEVGVGGPLLDWPDRVLPLVRAAPGIVRCLVGLVASGVDQAAAGKADEARLERGDLLGEVPAQPVRPVPEGVAREQRHHVEGDGAGAARGHRQPSRGARCGGDERAAVAGPAVVTHLDSHRSCRERVARPVGQRRGQRAALGPVGTGPHREVVLSPGLHRDAGVVARVGHAVAARSAAVEFEVQVPAVALVQPARVVDDLRRSPHSAGRRWCPGGQWRVRRVVGRAVLERAVLHELGVDPAVGGAVDVPEEDTVHGVRNGRTGAGGIDVHRVVGHGVRGLAHGRGGHGYERPGEQCREQGAGSGACSVHGDSRRRRKARIGCGRVSGRDGGAGRAGRRSAGRARPW